jgi:hypothetical protein
MSLTGDYQYRTEPFNHQRTLLDDTALCPAYGLLWEQGTGKTKPIIDNVALLYLAGEIDTLVVVAPPGVERNWITDEIPVHMPERVLAETLCFHWRAGKATQVGYKQKMEAAIKWKGLLVLCISYNAFITQRCKNYLWRVLKRRRCFYALDESHNIKTPKAKRTRSIIASGRYAPYKRIMTGTPITTGPFDIYSQIRFLDERFWAPLHIVDFASFKQFFGRWITRAEHIQLEGYDPGYDIFIEYRNLDLLKDVMAKISGRVLKEDVLDLPPKLYTKRYFDMNPDQQTAYDELKKEYIYEHESGMVVDAAMALVRLLRLQQIACGYIHDGSEEPTQLLGKSNPRLAIVEELRDSLGHQAIFWARFRHDIDQIMDLLGPGAARFDGAIDQDDCEWNKQAFNGGERQWLVATQKKGGSGHTFNVAKTNVHYSNSFSLIDRLQSEDRNHRVGQEGSDHGEHGFGVLNIDIQCPGTVDEHITKALRNNFNIAQQLNGDDLREWI